MPQPRASNRRLPAWARYGSAIVLLVVLIVTEIYWPQHSPLSAPYEREQAGYSGLVIETGVERVGGDIDSPFYNYAIVEEAPGRRVKHYVPPTANGILQGYHVIKEPGYGGRVYSPEYEEMMKQYRQYQAKQKR